MYTLGIDLHKEFALWDLLDEKGKVLREEKIPTDLELVSLKARKLPKPSQAVLEPVGCFALYAQRLEDEGIEVHLAHPSKVKLIAESKNKNDKIDAYVLAQLLRTKFLPEAYLPSWEIRELRSLIISRNQIVATRTRAKNRMRMLLTQLGIKTPKITDLFGKKGIKFLESLKLAPLYDLQKRQLIQTVETCNSQLRILNCVLQKVAQRSDDIQRMMSIPNIGTIAACTIKAYVGDFNRFPNTRKLTSYSGLVPSTRQSGSSTKSGHITRCGPSILRAVLVQAAAGIRPSAGQLYEFYKRKAYKIGIKKARIALAKKMLCIAYRVVVDKTEFVNKNKNTEMDKTCDLRSA